MKQNFKPVRGFVTNDTLRRYLKLKRYGIMAVFGYEPTRHAVPVLIIPRTRGEKKPKPRRNPKSTKRT